MLKVVIIMLLLTQFGFAQVNVIQRNNDAKFKFIEKWRTYTKTIQPSVRRFWTFSAPLIFEIGNRNIVADATQAVVSKYGSIDSQFPKIINVTQQNVNGKNYQLILEFTNRVEQQKRYQTILYYPPQNGPSQVVSCKPIENHRYYSNINESHRILFGETFKQFEALPDEQQTLNDFLDKDWIDENIANEWIELKNKDQQRQEQTELIRQAIATVDAEYYTQNFATISHFRKVRDIQFQVVDGDGTNYYIALQYENAQKQIQTFEVLIYSAPWLGDNQIVSLIQISDDYKETIAAMTKYFNQQDALKETDLLKEVKKYDEQIENREHREDESIQIQIQKEKGVQKESQIIDQFHNQMKY